MADADAEKRLRALKKKLTQIEKLVSRGTPLTAEEQAKVAGRGAIEAEIDALSSGGEVVAPPLAPDTEEPASASAVAEAAPVPTNGADASAPAAADDANATRGSEASAGAEKAAPAAAAAVSAADGGNPCRRGIDRCSELLPRLLLEPDAEKRVRQLQKKLREIEKLQDKLEETGKIEKLQEEKVATLPNLLSELGKLEEANPPPQPRQSGAKEGGSAKKSSKRWADETEAEQAAQKAAEDGEAGSDEEDDDEDDDAAREKEERKKAGGKEPLALKTKRQQQQAASSSAAKDSRPQEVVLSAAEATWPEVKDIAASGMGGIDKGRQKHVLTVNQGKGGAPYDTFDRYMLRFTFLTRLELKLPPGTLDSEIFRQSFPGNMLELVDLILQDNGLTGLPPKLGRLTRLRSLDISRNALTNLPDDGTWDKLSTSLECLDVSFNKLTSVETLAPLTKLSTLKLDGNQLTSLEGVSWRQLKQLTALSAIGNALEELPDEIAAAGETLEHIDVSENRITSIPVAICDLKKLKELGAAGNPIKDQKVVKYLEKGGKGLKELKVYLPKARTGKK